MLRPHLRLHILVKAGKQLGPGSRLRRQQGSIALLLLAALAITVGSLAIANSSSTSRLRSAFQGQSREARQAALDGADTIIGELNRIPNRRLLVTKENVTNWSNTDNLANDIYRNINCTSKGTMPTNEAINLTRTSVEERLNGTNPLGYRSVAGDNNRQFRLISIQKLSTKARASGNAYREADIDITPPPTGTPIDNGVGYLRLEVQGRVLRGGKEVSNATVIREYEVVPKCCGQSFGLPVDPSDTTTGAHGLDLNKCGLPDSPGNGQYGVVFGIGGGGLYDAGNSASGYLRTTNSQGQYVPIDYVVCAVVQDSDPSTTSDLEDCQSSGQFKDSQVSTSMGVIRRSITYNDFTKVPVFQQGGTTITPASLNGNTRGLQVTSGNVEHETYDKNTGTWGWSSAPYCRSYAIEGTLEYHCLIDSIQYGNNETLTVNTTNGDINLYVTSSKSDAVSFGGNSELLHVRGTPPVAPTSCATDGNAYINAFSIYGTPTDVGPPVGTSTAGDITSTQQISLQGGGSTIGVFVWAPYSLVVAKGGGSSDPNFCGRVWSNSLQLAGNVKFETPPSSGAGSGGGGGNDPTANLVDWVARSISELRLF